MILYNVTVSIEDQTESDWLNWMRVKHIPDVMATGCFIESRISKVHANAENGVSYAITYVSPTEEKYNEYLSQHSAELQKEHTARYSGKFAAFRTLLTVVEEFKK